MTSHKKYKPPAKYYDDTIYFETCIVLVIGDIR